MRSEWIEFLKTYGPILGLFGIGSFVLAARSMIRALRQSRRDEQFKNDDHTLELCKALSHESPRLRMAAAALLFEQLERLKRKGKTDAERSAIIQALLASTIVGQSQGVTGASSPELCKYIGDNVARAFFKRNDEGEIVPLPRDARSPFEAYYIQGAHLDDVDWADIDAHCDGDRVDFFKASFRGARFRRANLAGAVFYEATMTGAKFCGADLTRTNFQSADLRGADFRDDARKRKNGKDVIRATIFSGTKFSGAKLGGANFSNADLRAVDLSEVNFSDYVVKMDDGKDEIRKIKLTGAKYDSKTIFPKAISDPVALGMINLDVATPQPVASAQKAA